MQKLKILVVLNVISVLFSCQTDKNRETDLTQAFSFRKDTLLKFVKDMDTLPFTFEIELAQSVYQKETGLMHRKQMKANRGMLFIYENQRERQTFYMKNTFIPLDLIYLNSELEIVDFNLDTKPLSEDYISSEIPSMFVLELNAGQVNQLTIKKGDQVVLK
ncbi:hypothetical protein CXF67_15240 [Psychroflexus sp. MES1-P1E]|nr:hypothetical protein CXF67_15240 [Psychroflexus sp. MES1-P1E]